MVPALPCHPTSTPAALSERRRLRLNIVTLRRGLPQSRRRFEWNLAEARLPPGKTLDTFDFDAVPMISKAQVKALAAGDSWIEKGANLLCFGPPGGGKSHLAALGFALIENGWRVLFARTTDLVQKLQIACRDLVLESAVAKLDKYHLLIFDDLAYSSRHTRRDSSCLLNDEAPFTATPSDEICQRVKIQSP